MYTVDTGRGELVYSGTKLVPPRAARHGIVDSAHQGHFSPDTIYNDLRKYYFWPMMWRFVEANTKKCDKCRIHKKLKPHQQPFVPTELQASEPGEYWSGDIMAMGNIDYFSSMAIIYPGYCPSGFPKPFGVMTDILSMLMENNLYMCIYLLIIIECIQRIRHVEVLSEYSRKQ